MVQNVYMGFVVFWVLSYCFCCGYRGEPTVICADGVGSVETSKLCDYVANCSDASDELNFDLCNRLSKFDCHEKNDVMCESRSRYDADFDSHWSDRCTDLITACNVGRKCLSEDDLKLCEEVPDGRLKTPKFPEKSPKHGKTKEEEEFYKMMKFIGEAMNETLKRNFSECPPFFTPFVDQDTCISIFTPVQATWYEAQMFCESITGSLITLEEVEVYIKLLKFIQEKGIKSRFWVGGKLEESEIENATETKKSWNWINGESVTMGAPFWSLYTTGYPERDTQCKDNERKLMPRLTRYSENCLAVLNENFYYFSDEFCDSKLSPLCVTNKI